VFAGPKQAGKLTKVVELVGIEHMGVFGLQLRIVPEIITVSCS